MKIKVWWAICALFLLMVLGGGISSLYAQAQEMNVERAAAWHPSAPVIVVAENHATESELSVSFWHASGRFIATFTFPSQMWIDPPIWSPEGTLLAIPVLEAGEQYNLVVFNTADLDAPLQIDFTLPHHEPFTAAWSEGATLNILRGSTLERFIVAGTMPPARQYDLATLSALATDWPTKAALAIGPEGWLATTRTDAVLVWRFADDGRLDYQDAIPYVDFEGQLVPAWGTEGQLAIGVDHLVHIFEPETDTLRYQRALALSEADAKVRRLLWGGTTLVAIAYSDNGTLIEVWESETWQKLATFSVETDINSLVALSGDGSHLLKGIDETFGLDIVWGVNALDEPLILTASGYRLGETSARSSCQLKESGFSLLFGFAVPETPHDLSSVVMADEVVYDSIRLEFTSPADVSDLLPFNAVYVANEDDPIVPNVPRATTVIGQDLPAQTLWTIQLRNLANQTCSTVIVEYDCTSGEAQVVQYTTQCLYP